MNAPLPQDWTIANQQLLVAEFNRLSQRLLPTADGRGDPAPALAQARQALSGDSAIDWLAREFGLSGFERDVLLLCAGVEMSGELAHACAQAQGDPGRPWVSFGLALSTLVAKMRSVVSLSVVNLSRIYPTKPDLAVLSTSMLSMPDSMEVECRVCKTVVVRRSPLPPMKE